MQNCGTETTVRANNDARTRDLTQLQWEYVVNVTGQDERAGEKPSVSVTGFVSVLIKCLLTADCRKIICGVK